MDLFRKVSSLYTNWDIAILFFKLRNNTIAIFESTVDRPASSDVRGKAERSCTGRGTISKKISVCDHLFGVD